MNENLNQYPYNLFNAIKDGREHIQLPEKVNEDNERGLWLALSYLKPREREIIIMKYQNGMTLKEIGQRFGVIGERIRQILTHAIRTLAAPKLVAMINKGPQGYIEYAVEKRAKQIAEVLEEEAYKKGYRDGYSDGEKQIKEKLPTMISGSNIPIEDLDISVRPYNCLVSIGAETVFDILQFTDEDIKNIKNLGKKSSIEIALALREKGIISDAWERLIDKV